MDMHELLRDQAAVVNYIADQSQIMASSITNLISSLDALQFNQNSKPLLPRSNIVVTFSL